MLDDDPDSFQSVVEQLSSQGFRGRFGEGQQKKIDGKIFVGFVQEMVPIVQFLTTHPLTV